jgi:hypothetical protein
MTAARPDPTAEVPEADLLEQRTPLDPDADIDPEAGAPVLGQSSSEADDADRLEQLAVVPDADEDDRPRGGSGPDWL